MPPSCARPSARARRAEVQGAPDPHPVRHNMLLTGEGKAGKCFAASSVPRGAYEWHL
ncbi:hypothetical protein [Sphingopyxis terrae]|uniref:hypothetical protein n=1 Tax=Sphingopyxis terrae TaxID=33052 RepID=UPI003625DFD2